jgi:hypothetical protein
MRHSVPVALLLGAGTVALAPAGSPVLAQQPNRPPACAVRDSGARADSARADSTRAVSPNHGPIALAVAAFVAVPSALLLLPGVECSPDTARLGFWRPRVVSAFVTGRGAVGGADADEEGGTLSADMEVLWRGVYAAGRLEHFHLPARLQSRSAWVGYLIRPTRAVAGGVTLGYREAHGRRLPEGVEVGFPVMRPFYSVGKSARRAGSAGSRPT